MDKSYSANRLLRIGRDAAAVVFMVVVSWKLANSDISVDLGQIDLSNLMTLLLAVFAIALSAAFYFQANKTSHRFYDNVYKFTQETSELLGRMESGFGERLRHLDEGYSGIIDKIDRFAVDPAQAKADIEKEESEAKRTEEERNELIENMLKKAQLNEKEQEQFREKLNALESELAQSHEEIVSIKMASAHSRMSIHIPGAVRSFLNRRLIRNLKPSYWMNATETAIQKRVDSASDNFPEQVLRFMVDNGFLDSHFLLTKSGARFVRQLARDFYATRLSG